MKTFGWIVNGICAFFLLTLLAVLAATFLWGNGYNNMEAVFSAHSALSAKYGPQTDRYKFRIEETTLNQATGDMTYAIDFDYNRHRGVIHLVCHQHNFRVVDIEENSR